MLASSPLNFFILPTKCDFVISFQVLGESLRLTTDYLHTKEKVVVANSKVESMKAKSSRLRKDLIKAMDEATKEKGSKSSMRR